MATIYTFTARRKTLREMIEAGRLTARIRKHLQEAYHRHALLYPDDGDTAWIGRMLARRGAFTPEDKRRLQELLQYEIAEEEHPNGFLAMRPISRNRDMP